MTPQPHFLSGHVEKNTPMASHFQMSLVKRIELPQHSTYKITLWATPLLEEAWHSSKSAYWFPVTVQNLIYTACKMPLRLTASLVKGEMNFSLLCKFVTGLGTLHNYFLCDNIWRSEILTRFSSVSLLRASFSYAWHVTSYKLKSSQKRKNSN